jgi:cell shape-determining protein MreC
MQMNGKKLLLIAVGLFVVYYIVVEPQLASQGISTVSSWAISIGETVVDSFKSFVDAFLT